MCLCGHKLVADTLEQLWEAFDQHCDEKHGRRWPRRLTTKEKR